MNSIFDMLGRKEAASLVINEPVITYKPEYHMYTLVLQIILSLAVVLASSLYCLYKFHRKKELHTKREIPSKSDIVAQDKESEGDAQERQQEENCEADATDNQMNLDNSQGDASPFQSIIPTAEGKKDVLDRVDDILWKKYDALINSDVLPWQMIDIKIPPGSKYPKNLFEGDGTSSEEETEGIESSDSMPSLEPIEPERDIIDETPTESCPSVPLSPVVSLERKRSSTSLQSQTSSRGESFCLRDVRVSIPSAVRRGDSVFLHCLYDIEDDSLYSIKWYKDRREFYRFTPKETPSMKIFPLHGVSVERSRSNDSQLVLAAVEPTVSGQYSCEVTADAPSFHTYLVGGDMEVVETPRHNPIITGIRPRYKLGDILRGNCTSKHSRPPANLTWQINGHSANINYVRHFKPLREHSGLETAVSAVHFVVTRQHFNNGRLKLRCTASMHSVYWKSTERSIEEDRPRSHKNRNKEVQYSKDGLGAQSSVGRNVQQTNLHGEDELADQDDAYNAQPKTDAAGSHTTNQFYHQSKILSYFIISAYTINTVIRWLI